MEKEKLAALHKNNKGRIMTQEELKEIRLEMNLSQTEFGIALGFVKGGAQRAIYDLENGVRPIRQTVAKLARFLIKEHRENAPAKHTS